MTLYFTQYRHGHCPYGFVPLLSGRSSQSSTDSTGDGSASNSSSSNSSSSGSGSSSGSSNEHVEPTAKKQRTEDSTVAGTTNIPYIDDKVPPQPTAGDTGMSPPSHEQLVAAFLGHVDFGKLLLDLWKFHVRSCRYFDSIHWLYIICTSFFVLYYCPIPPSF